MPEGETVQSESYQIDGWGRFTWTRTTSRKVGFLGAEIRAVDRDTAARLNAPPFVGVVVTSVDGDGPADHAGLLRDDIILVFADQPAMSVVQFGRLVEEAEPGTEVDIGFLRDEVREDFTVTMGSSRRMSSETASRDLPVIDDRRRTGMILAQLGPETSARLTRDASTPGGVMVAEVLPGGPAFLAGLYRGDLLVLAANRPVRSGEDWSATAGAAAPGTTVGVVAFRRGRRTEARLVPEEDATRVRESSGPLWLYYRKDSAPDSRFSLLWGILWRERTNHEVLDLGSGDQHASARGWGRSSTSSTTPPETAGARCASCG